MPGGRYYLVRRDALAEFGHQDGESRESFERTLHEIQVRDLDYMVVLFAVEVPWKPLELGDPEDLIAR